MRSRTGELPLEIIRMKAKGCEVELVGNDPGFTLPSNIGELGDDITQLDLSNCSLQGLCWPSSTRGILLRSQSRAQAPYPPPWPV